MYQIFNPVLLNLPDTVEYTIQAKPKAPVQNNVTKKTSQSSAQNNKQMLFAMSNEPNADVRLVEAEMMEIEQPIIDFYDLCSYNIKYCN